MAVLRILVVNAGSSSLKVDLVADGDAVAHWEGLPGTPPDVDAVGHRIVHGGPDLVEPVVIDDAVEKKLRDLVELAPLHQPKSLAGLAAARELLPGVPHVACFDTAFHGTLPDAAATFAALKARGVLIKNVSAMHPLLANCLRFTVGTPDENTRLLAELTSCLS